MNRHLMIDIETMGQRFDAPILSIGAVFFDPDTGALGETFYEAIDIEDAFRFGKPSGSTVKWWMGQGDAARQAATAGTASLNQALTRLSAFFKTSPPQAAGVWGNGPTFDISILEYAFMRLDIKVPWPFWLVRDCRTIKDVGAHLNIDTSVKKGTAHNALDDAISQAKWVSAIWRGLRKPDDGMSLI